MPPKTRGKQRFAGLTYAQIAAWVELETSTVQTYAQRKVFDVHSLANTLCWVNRRRERAGLPLIGVPATEAPDPPAN